MPRYRLVNVGACLMLAALAIGFADRFGALAAFNRHVLELVALTLGQSAPLAIDLARAISWAGDPAQRTILSVVLALGLATQRRWRHALLVLVVPAFAAITASVLKEGFASPRPDAANALAVVDGFAYPSGHAAGAAALALLVSFAVTGWRPRLVAVLAAVFAGAVGVSRLLLGVHWPGDVAGGWLWGAGIALLCWWRAQPGQSRAP